MAPKFAQEGEKLPPKPTRPNYNIIHSLPLPLNVHPLPPLIPHNPLSILQIVYCYVFQFISPPSPLSSPRYQAYFSPETRSIHVLDLDTARALWEKGFFGKGSLSRSEPTWSDRELKRNGNLVSETAEETTRRRREERKEFKKERARKERDAIENKLTQEKGLRQDLEKLPLVLENGSFPEYGPRKELDGNGSLDRQTNYISSSDIQENSFPRANDSYLKSQKAFAGASLTAISTGANRELPPKTRNQEHLQLTLEEAFFLAYGLGVLEIRNLSNSELMPINCLFSLFRQHSYFPPCNMDRLAPDDPFLLSYVVYHHFRALGWVVRPGIKFGVDYMLYNRGPVFAHAEFAAIILPSYGNQYWSSTAEARAETAKKEKKSWWWLHCVNRVQSQVRKSLVLVYVDVAPPSTSAALDVGKLLGRYKVRELTLKRWVPNRSRD